MAWLGVRPVVSWLHGVRHDLKLNSCSNYRFKDFPVPRSNTIPRADNLSIGDLSRHTGVNIETIRYHERIGLLAIIKVAQRAGIPLAAVQKAIASLRNDRVPTLADWRKLSTAWKRELNGRILKLT